MADLCVHFKETSCRKLFWAVRKGKGEKKFVHLEANDCEKNFGHWLQVYDGFLRVIVLRCILKLQSCEKNFGHWLQEYEVLLNVFVVLLFISLQYC